MAKGRMNDNHSIRERAYAHIQRKTASDELRPGDAVSAITARGYFKGLYDANIPASLYDVVQARRRSVAAGILNSIGWLGGGLAVNIPSGGTSPAAGSMLHDSPPSLVRGR